MGTASSFSVIENICSAVAGFHSAVGVASPTSHPMPKAVKEAAHRLLPSRVNKKEPLTLQNVHDMCERFAGQGCTPRHLLWCAAISFAFAGFYRFSDWSQVRVRDVAFKEGLMIVFLAKRKNDQHREGSYQVMSAWRTPNGRPSPACPVTLVKRHISMSNLLPDGYLFADPKFPNSAIPYPMATAGFKEKIGAIGLHVEDYSTHSARSGGMTAGANAGVDLEKLMEHGGWRSKEAAVGYIKSSVESKRQVTAAIFASAISPPRAPPDVAAAMVAIAVLQTSANNDPAAPVLAPAPAPAPMPRPAPKPKRVKAAKPVSAPAPAAAAEAARRPGRPRRLAK